MLLLCCQSPTPLRRTWRPRTPCSICYCCNAQHKALRVLWAACAGCAQEPSALLRCAAARPTSCTTSCAVASLHPLSLAAAAAAALLQPSWGSTTSAPAGVAPIALPSTATKQARPAAAREVEQPLRCRLLLQSITSGCWCPLQAGAPPTRGAVAHGQEDRPPVLCLQHPRTRALVVSGSPAPSSLSAAHAASMQRTAPAAAQLLQLIGPAEAWLLASVVAHLPNLGSLALHMPGGELPCWPPCLQP
jgi:hypothetical protein